MGSQASENQTAAEEIVTLLPKQPPPTHPGPVSQSHFYRSIGYFKQKF